MNTTRTEVRRDRDGELLGFVEPATSGGWRALTVFGAELSTVTDRDAAVREVEEIGLAALTERWWYRVGDGWQPAVLQEAEPGRVVAVIGDDAAFAGVIGAPDVPLPRVFIGADAEALRRRPG